MQDVFKDMMLSSTESLKKMFEVLSNEENYPVLICDRYGTIQASIAVALVMWSLDIPEQTIMEDYQLSNKFFNIRKIAAEGSDLPLESQDAITTMMLSDEKYLAAGLMAVKRKYGSVSQYLKEALEVDEDMQNQLKNILLNQ